MTKYCSLIFISSFLLAACGGGGGGSEDNSNGNISPPTSANFTLSLVNAAFGDVHVNQNGSSEICASNQTCEYTLPENTLINLQATAANNYRLKNWGGECIGNAECNITLSNNMTVTTEYELLSLASRSCTEASPVPAIPDISWQTVVSGLNNPIGINYADDGSNRLFITEAGGVIRTISSGSIDANPFLDIQDRSIANSWASFAPHPDFSSNGLFYVYYISQHTSVNPNGKCSSVSPTQCIIVSEFNTADIDSSGIPASERILLDIPLGTLSNTEGHIAFGPETSPLLYISTGDGDIISRPFSAEYLDVLNGKLLRIDINNQDTGLEYAVPHDNPTELAGVIQQSIGGSTTESIYTGVDAFGENITGNLAIWAYGFEQPAHFSFDPLNGRLFLGDSPTRSINGSATEINVVKSTRFYGTPLCSGEFQTRSGPDCAQFTGTGGSIFYTQEEPDLLNAGEIAGVVYRGDDYPDLCGTFLYADAASGDISGSRYDGNTFSGTKSLASLNGGNLITSFGIDANFEVYAVSRTNGSLHKLMVP